MGAASYNRGTKQIAREADAAVGAPSARMTVTAYKDEAARLRARVQDLERDLARARRCIFELRRMRNERTEEARAEQSRNEFAIKTLCKIAFPDDA